ncbi:MAG: hypothetical protein FJ255_05685 [Phycisphaerae bacterium]|nr:hypothetical protein [Phycisphaerae bacterium]
MPGEWVGGEFGAFPFGPNQTDAIMAVHMVHVYHQDWDHWGRWLVWGYGTDTPYATPRCYLWTPPRENEPGNGTFQSVPNTRTNLFCCGHCPLADGRVLTAGGDFDHLGNAATVRHSWLLGIPAPKHWQSAERVA